MTCKSKKDGDVHIKFAPADSIPRLPVESGFFFSAQGGFPITQIGDRERRYNWVIKQDPKMSNYAKVVVKKKPWEFTINGWQIWERRSNMDNINKLVDSEELLEQNKKLLRTTSKSAKQQGRKNAFKDRTMQGDTHIAEGIDITLNPIDIQSTLINFFVLGKFFIIN